MANNAVIAFHNANAEDERRRLALRIAQGTKASSPEIISYRIQHPSFHGIITNPKGSFNSVFFKNKDETHAPFASEIRGGVIKDFRYAQKLLKQRADSAQNIMLAKEGQLPLEKPLLEMTDIESKGLELNQMLQDLQDAVEAGGTASGFADTSSVLRRIFSLYITLLPSFEPRQIQQFIVFFESIAESALPRVRRAGADRMRQGRLNRLVTEYMIGGPEGGGGLIELSRDYIPFAKSEMRVKSAKIREFVRKYFPFGSKEVAARMREAQRLMAEEAADAEAMREAAAAIAALPLVPPEREVVVEEEADLPPRRAGIQGLQIRPVAIGRPEVVIPRLPPPRLEDPAVYGEVQREANGYRLMRREPDRRAWTVFAPDGRPVEGARNTTQARAIEIFERLAA